MLQSVLKVVGHPVVTFIVDMHHSMMNWRYRNDPLACSIETAEGIKQLGEREKESTGSQYRNNSTCVSIKCIELQKKYLAATARTARFLFS